MPKWIARRLILSLGMFLTSACAFTQATTPLNQPTEEFIIEGLCENPFFPVTQNATWTYASTDGTNNFTYIETISAVHPSGFTLTTQTNESTYTQEWACETGGLKALQLDTFTKFGINNQWNTEEVIGVTLPKEMVAGMQWLYSINLEQATYTVVMQEQGIENITVSAGSFETIKIEATHKLENSLEATSNFTASSTIWYASNIGYIKSINTLEQAGVTKKLTTELQSYSIP